MNKLTLAEVDEKNWQACVALETLRSQSGFAFSASYSLAQCAYTPGMTALAAQVEGEIVGHIAIKRDPKCSWIVRVIIDRKFQGRGYGRMAVSAAIDVLFEETPCNEIKLSVAPGNDVADRLYLSLGFHLTGEVKDDGDVVYALSRQKWDEFQGKVFS